MNAEFEKYAKEQLGSYEMSVDTDALWADVSAQIRPENPRRKGGLWFFLLGITVGLSLFGLFFINKNNNYTETSTTAVSEKANNTDPKENLSITPAIENEALKQENKEANINSTNDPLYREATIVNIHSTKEASAVKNTAIARSTNHKSIPLQNSGSNSNHPSNLNNTLVLNDNEANTSVVLNENNEPVSSDVILDARKGYQAVSLLPTLSTKFLYSDKNLPPEFLVGYKSLPTNFDKKDIGKKGRRRGAFFRDLRFGVGLYGGISRSNSDLEAKNVSAESFLVARTNSEKQLETLHLGLNAIVQSERNFFFSTGIEYTRIGSLFSKESQRIEQDSMPGIVEIQVNGVTGERDTIFGTVGVTRTIDFTKKSYNYFHLVDVPIIFGYNFGEDPWRIGVEAGIYANVLIRNKGDIGLDTDAFYDIGEDEEGWYRDNIGISPYVGINAAYNLTENIQIHLTPSFRFNSLFSTDANPLEQQHGSLGVRAGVRYLFD